jgi:uncharacterized protein
MDFKNIFRNTKPIIGMIHLGYFPGHKQFQGKDSLISRAIKDLHILQDNGVDGVILENWEDQTVGAFVQMQDRAFFEEVAQEIAKEALIPIGINVLPNDYISAFSIAEKINAQFIQVDVLVDRVRTNYTHSKVKNFVIDVNQQDFQKIRLQYPNIALLASIKPKHYTMLDEKSIETSAKEAIKSGANALVITGDFTGLSPDINELSSVKALSSVPILVGSGLDPQNCSDLIQITDGASVGTSIKNDDFTEVVGEKVKRLIQSLKK